MSEMGTEVKDFLEILDATERKDKNKVLITHIESLSKMEKQTFVSLRIIKSSMVIIFVLGLVLIVSAIVLIFLDVGSEDTTKIGEAIALLVGGTLSEAFGAYLYRPMRQLINSESDIMQQYIILTSWAIFLNLELLAMNVNKPETVVSAAKEISEQTLKHIKWMQEHVETKKPEEEKPKTNKE